MKKLLVVLLALSLALSFCSFATAESAKLGVVKTQYGEAQGVAGSYAYDEHGNLKQAPITVLTFKNAAPTPLASY